MSQISIYACCVSAFLRAFCPFFGANDPHILLAPPLAIPPLHCAAHSPIAQPSSIEAVARSCGIGTMMTVRNYSTTGATPVVVQRTNIGEQAPLLLLKAWINRHTTDMPGCLSCRARMSFSMFSCISQVTSVYVGSLIGLAIPWEITPP